MPQLQNKFNKLFSNDFMSKQLQIDDHFLYKIIDLEVTLQITFL